MSKEHADKRHFSNFRFARMKHTDRCRTREHEDEFLEEHTDLLLWTRLGWCGVWQEGMSLNQPGCTPKTETWRNASLSCIKHGVHKKYKVLYIL